MEEDADNDDDIANYLNEKLGQNSKPSQKAKKTIKFNSDDDDDLMSSPPLKARKAKSKAAKRRVVVDTVCIGLSSLLM